MNFTTALKLDPEWPEAPDTLARLFATSLETKWRNPTQAVRLYYKLANEITGQTIPSYLETLAMTCAASGNFSNAMSTADLAEQKARIGNLNELADKIVIE